VNLIEFGPHLMPPAQPDPQLCRRSERLASIPDKPAFALIVVWHDAEARHQRIALKNARLVGRIDRLPNL